MTATATTAPHDIALQTARRPLLLALPLLLLLPGARCGALANA